MYRDFLIYTQFFSCFIKSSPTSRPNATGRITSGSTISGGGSLMYKTMASPSNFNSDSARQARAKVSKII